MWYGLTRLGVVHTAISIVAVIAGFVALASHYVETIGYSATLLFHMIPAVTETTTRLPLGHPLLSSPEAPQLQTASAVLFVLFLRGAWLQVRALRASGTK